MSTGAKKKDLRDVEDLHLEMPPWEFVCTYLNIYERRFMRKLIQTGDYSLAMAAAGYKCALAEVLQRPHMQVAIRRCAWLAKDPVTAAKVAMPLVMQKQIEMVMGGGKSAMPASKALTDMSGQLPAQKHAILKADLTKELTRGQGEEERPWVDKSLPWRRIHSDPGLLPSQAVDRPQEEIEEAVEQVVGGLGPADPS